MVANCPGCGRMLALREKQRRLQAPIAQQPVQYPHAAINPGVGMPFYRFEELESKYLTPHLSTGKAPVIEGRYMYFCLVHKAAGTGSELHYHPNELLIFPLRGLINAIVGNDRRVVGPGTFVHAPAYARHSMKATEDGDLSYLYIKDKTWTVVGLAADQAVPDKAFTVDEINRLIGGGGKRDAVDGPSQAVIEGLHECYYPLI